MANLSTWRGYTLGSTEFDRFRREFDRLFDGFFGNYNAPAARNSTALADHAVWSPACDMHESDKAYFVRCDMPGISDKDVELSVASNQLMIKGDRKAAADESSTACLFSERSYGSFYRTFTFPTAVDSSKIRARVNHGVLEIELPKSAPNSMVKVKIEQK